jgi:IS30 family transposase
MKYRRVTNEHRLCLKTMLDAELSQATIANKLGFHPSTISRELGRNRGSRGYRFKQSQQMADARQAYRLNPRKMLPGMVESVVRKIRLKWSPEQTSNWLKLHGKPFVSTQTIYTFLHEDKKDGGKIWKNLRYSHKLRRRRFPNEERRGKIQNARSISERANSANKRKKRGHWERDTMLGHNRRNVVLVITDRKTRYNLFSKLDRRLAPLITARTAKLLKGFPVRSITNDRGQEFSGHQKLERKLGKPIYFCDPYSSYQRGTNENRIGILRQYLPKGSDISKLHGRTLKKFQDAINNRPMKCLGWRTPHELMLKKNCAAG